MVSANALIMPGCAAGACLHSMPINDIFLVSGFSTLSIGHPSCKFLHIHAMALTALTRALDCHKNSSSAIGSTLSTPMYISLPARYFLTSSAVVTALCNVGISAAPTTRVALRKREFLISSSEADAFSSRPTPQSTMSCAKGSMNRALSSSLSSASVPFPGCLRKDALATFFLLAADLFCSSTFRTLVAVASTALIFAMSETISGSAKTRALLHATATARPA